MNIPTLIVLLLVAVALFFALRSWRRAVKRGGSGCNGCPSAGADGSCPEAACRNCPQCPSAEDRTAGWRK